MTPLSELLPRALDARSAWLETLTDTDTWRVFHGAVEGRPGLTIDRYGPVLLIQSFREVPEKADLDDIEAFARDQLDWAEAVVWNHRGKDPVDAPALDAAMDREHVVKEEGMRFMFRPRHRGNDPWLFLDFRAGRRAVRARAAGARMLNLFSYTCGAGVAAGVGGAASVRNVDFSESALKIGKDNGSMNLPKKSVFHTDQANVLPAMRQLSGQKVRGRGGRKPYKRFAPETFDLIVLDPPTFSRSPFGAVDSVRDYASMFKPCVLSVAKGGAILATNHVSTVDREEWMAGLRRCAEKAGRPLTDVEVIVPDADFPSPDGRNPLKMAWCTVS